MKPDTTDTTDTNDDAVTNLQAHSLRPVETPKDQKGRIKANPRTPGLPINDNDGLERCADEMGARALKGAAMLDTELTHISSHMQERPL